MITREPKIGILPKPTNILYIIAWSSLLIQHKIANHAHHNLLTKPRALNATNASIGGFKTQYYTLMSRNK